MARATKHMRHCWWDNDVLYELPTEFNFDGQSKTLLLSWLLQWIWHRNQGFYHDSRERIKSWKSKSAPILIIHILKNTVNSCDSNGAITVPISALGDEKWNLLFFCLPIFPQNPLNIMSHIIRRWKDIFKENIYSAVGIMGNGSELMEKFQKSVLWIWTLGGDEVWTPD